MILFKPQHVALILSGQKTQTRRLWPSGRRVNPGSTQQARTKMLDASSTFTNLQIKKVWQERLSDISEADSRAEGYADREAYLAAFCMINKMPKDAALDCVVWCVAFEMAGKEGA